MYSAKFASYFRLPGSLSNPYLHHLSFTCILCVNWSRDKMCIYKHVCLHILCCTYCPLPFFIYYNILEIFPYYK